jgi:hypothetical protein
MSNFKVVGHIPPIVNGDTRIVILELPATGSKLYRRDQPLVSTIENT